MNFITYTREEVLAALKAHKESIAYTQADRKRILSNPNLTILLDGLKAHAKEFSERPILSLSFHNFRRYEEDGNRSAYENEYFAHRGMLETFALMAWIYEDEEYLHKLEDVIWAICDEYSWPVAAHMRGTSLSEYQEECPNVDLFAAETAEAFAEILSLLGDKLHPTVVMRMRKRLEERIFGQLHQDFAWKTVKICNWAAVCAGSVGMAAMYEIKDEERLADILMICLASVDRFIGGYTEDGVCTEGTMYWSYGFGYFMAFADLLKRRTGDKLDLFQIEKVHLMATFISKVFFPHGRSISFADGGSRTQINPSTISYLKNVYLDMQMPSEASLVFKYPTDTNYRFALALRKFIDMQSEPFIEKESELTYIFPAAKWYLSTSKDRNISIAAKAGHNEEAHNHNDVGSFQIFKNGQQILADVGTGVYDKFYFSDIRYSIFCAGSQGHNVPIINGKYQKTGRKFAAENTIIDQEGIRYDFQAAYDIPTLEKLHRDITFDKSSGAVALKDVYHFTETPSSIVERFVTEFEPTFSDGVVKIGPEGAEMSLYYDKNAWDPTLYVEQKARGGADYKCVFYCIDFSPKSLDKDLTFALEIK
ncbi:MAG: heparinase II/III family protein [Clostridia bacterium]|nr:heparinase II/III family protein [Clostridia bacterium]